MNGQPAGLVGIVLVTLVGGGGLWSVARAALDGRRAVRLERERNVGTAVALDRMPPGSRLTEVDGEGRSRLITVAHHTERPAVPRAGQEEKTGATAG